MKKVVNNVVAKKFYMSRTVWVAALEILSALLLFAADFVGKGDFSVPAYLLLANGVVMIFLRHLTTVPVEFNLK